MMTENAGGKAKFLGVGKGFRVTFTSRTPGTHIGLNTVQEGRFDNSTWIPGRRLNGDETDQNATWRFDPRSLHTETASTFEYR